MAIKYATKDDQRFRLDADCYHPDLGGYLKKGEIVVVPEGYALSQTWTEVDEAGEPVPGGQKSKKITRHIDRGAGESRTVGEIADADEEPEAAEESPPPPAAAAKPKPAPAPKKPAAAAKPKK